jgi:ABC-type transport system involved in cytochrome c biogenesis permease component
MGKLTISTGPFSIAMLNYQRVIGKNVFLLYLCVFELAMLVGGSGSTLVVACNPGGATSPISSIPFQTAILLFVSGIV